MHWIQYHPISLHTPSWAGCILYCGDLQQAVEKHTNGQGVHSIGRTYHKCRTKYSAKTALQEFMLMVSFYLKGGSMTLELGWRGNCDRATFISSTGPSSWHSDLSTDWPVVKTVSLMWTHSNIRNLKQTRCIISFHYSRVPALGSKTGGLWCQK